MLAKVYSCAVFGLDGQIIEVEIDKGGGVSKFIMVGLPDTAVQESRVRVRAAIRNSGLSFPMGIVHRQSGPRRPAQARPRLRFAHRRGRAGRRPNQMPAGHVGKAVFIGELALDGSLRHVNGILPMADFARRAGIQDPVRARWWMPPKPP